MQAGTSSRSRCEIAMLGAQSAHGVVGWIVQADTCAFTAAPDAAPPPCGLPYGIGRAAACAAYLCPPLCRLPLVSPPVAHRSWPAIHRHSPPLAAARCRSPHTHLRRPSRTLRARHGSPTAASRLCRAACTTPVSSRRSRCRAIHNALRARRSHRLHPLPPCRWLQSYSAALPLAAFAAAFAALLLP